MEQYLIWKELLQSRQTEHLVKWWQEFYVYFYQAFIEGDRWMQYLKGVGTTLIVTALALPLPWQHAEWAAFSILLINVAVTIWICFVLFGLKRALTEGENC